MRITLVVHGFPPHERTGVENYTEGLARSLGKAGHVVEVFSPRKESSLPEYSMRREEREFYNVTWLTLNKTPDGPRAMLNRPGVGRSFARFLECERPEVVHFQHVVKLGVAPVFEASKRKIPIVYTAHDYYGVCHRYTLLRPDLSHCDVRADFMACALCDVALGYLNGLEGLGDYQMGVLPEQLDERQTEALKGLLDDDPQAAGLEHSELDQATDLRRDLDSLRLQAFSRMDLVLAPTKFLGAELARGGISPDRIRVLPYGVETKDLTDLAPILGAEAPNGSAGASGVAGDSGALRFAFFGGLAKHKGVHVLLEAFGLLEDEGRASLAVWGYGTDEAYIARLKEQAKAVGANWGGAYKREELPGILSQADVVVVPSTWVENQPLVIREAFAAGRPVIASDFGAIPESVRHDVDGLLFAVNDSAALAQAMKRCLNEKGLVARLAGNIQPVHDAADQAKELETIYAGLIRSAGEAQATQNNEPKSVRAFGERVRALQAMPTRALFQEALEGLSDLRRELSAGRGDSGDPGNFERRLGRMLRMDPRARITLRDTRREVDWLRRKEDAGELDRELNWLRGEIEERDIALRSRSEEVDWLHSQIEERDQHLAWLTQEHDALVRDVGQLEELERSIGQVDHDHDSLDELEERFADLRQRMAEVGGRAANISSIVHHFLEAQAMLASAELEPLLEGLHALTDLPMPQDGEYPADALMARVRGAGNIGGQLLDELGWRRELMATAQDKAKRRLIGVLIARTGLGREVNSWPTPRSRPTPQGENS